MAVGRSLILFPSALNVNRQMGPCDVSLYQGPRQHFPTCVRLRWDMIRVAGFDRFAFAFTFTGHLPSDHIRPIPEPLAIMMAVLHVQPLSSPLSPILFVSFDTVGHWQLEPYVVMDVECRGITIYSASP